MFNLKRLLLFFSLNLQGNENNYNVELNGFFFFLMKHESFNVLMKHYREEISHILIFWALMNYTGILRIVFWEAFKNRVWRDKGNTSTRGV